MEPLPLNAAARVVTAHVKLQAGAFAAFLEIALPLPYGDGIEKWLPCRLRAHTESAALGFIGEIAQWLSVPVPARQRIEVDASYHWGAQKLSLDGGDRHAEIFLNLIEGGQPVHHALAGMFEAGEATLDEKDPESREDFIGLLLEEICEPFGAAGDA